MSWEVIASDSTECDVVCDSNSLVSKLWFKTAPVTRDFCKRVARIKLYAESHRQDYVSYEDQGSWSWFVIALFADDNAKEPRTETVNGTSKSLSWFSHANTDNSTFKAMFGKIFERGDEIFSKLEVFIAFTALYHILTCSNSQGMSSGF